MADRAWMLNPQAIRIAKKCINLIKEEFGEKLTLSDPMFMQSLHQYVDMSKSRSLGTAYGRLLSMAGVGTVMQGLSNKIDLGDRARHIPAMKMAVGAELQGSDRV